MLESILITYVVLTALAFLCFYKKPFWTHAPNGQRVRVHAPVGKFLIVAVMVGWVMVSLVPHIIFRFLGFQGFFDSQTGSYQPQNPFVRTTRL